MRDGMMKRWALAAFSRLPVDARDPSEKALNDERLLAAEKDIRWLRNFGILGWYFVLRALGYEPALDPVWAVYLVSVAAAACAHVAVSRSANIRRTATATTFLDPMLGAMICLVTGGIESVMYPFFYFTLMSVAVRFGVLESVGIAVLNGGLTVALYVLEPIYRGGPGPGLPVLGATLFLLMFAAALGAVVAEWARHNSDLVMAHARTLREAGQRYQAFVRRFAQVQEEERKNISAELHDRMSGHMFQLRRGIEHCMDEALSREQLHERLASLSATVGACTRDVRSIMNELRPTVLDELGFFEAASEFLARQAEIAPYRLVYRIDPALKDWRSRQDAMLFRLLKEALLNVQKHANARNVEVGLQIKGDRVELSIDDDGVGFDPLNVPIGHYGLMTMRERAEAAGGELQVESGGVPGGTRISALLPRHAK